MSPTFATAAHPALVGETAQRWIAEQGWDTDRAQPFQLSAERLGNQTFSVSRIWHSSAALCRSSTTSTRSDRVLILIGVDAGGSLSVGDRSWDITERQIVIADAGSPLQLVTPNPTSRLEVVMPRHRLGAAQHILEGAVEVGTAEESYWRTLAALIVTVLGAGISEQDPGFKPIRAAIEQAVIAAIMHSSLSAAPTCNPHVRLLARARGIIEERFDDAGFSTRELARALAVSSAHLYRIFRATSETPYQIVQNRRALHAVDLMRYTQVSELDAAAQSGFSSLRAMRRAIEKHVDLTREGPIADGQGGSSEAGSSVLTAVADC